MSGDSWSGQGPRAPVHEHGVPSLAVISWTTSAGLTPPASLLRAHAPGLHPPRASVVSSDTRSMQVAVSPCWEEDLPDVLSAPPSLRAWTSTPAAPEVHLPVSSLKTSVFPRSDRVGAPQCPCSDSAWRPLRGCSHSLTFRPAGLLTTPVAPPATAYAAWQPWFLRPSLSWFVTSPRPGYTNRPNRAIDGMRTFTSSDAQPCRLLPERWRSPAAGSGSAADAVGSQVLG
jgi:hypothetical protein